jgi:hypothetical protein
MAVITTSKLPPKEFEVTDIPANSITEEQLQIINLPFDGAVLTISGASMAWDTVSGIGADEHSELLGLDYASSGHTGFSPTVHTHVETDVTDLDKYTQTEVDTISGTLQTQIDGKADDPHTHVEVDITDLDKYTQTEVDQRLATTSGVLQTDIDDHRHDGHTLEADGIQSDATEFVFNNAGNDVDLRVASNNFSHALFVDGGADSVHIKESRDPTTLAGYPNAFTVTGDPSTDPPMMQLHVSDDIYPVFQFYVIDHNNSGMSWDMYYDGTWRGSHAGNAAYMYLRNNRWRFANNVSTGAGNALTMTRHMDIINANIADAGGVIVQNVATDYTPLSKGPLWVYGQGLACINLHGADANYPQWQVYSTAVDNWAMSIDMFLKANSVWTSSDAGSNFRWYKNQDAMWLDHATGFAINTTVTTFVERVRFDTGVTSGFVETVFNDDGEDIDFRVESNTKTRMLFVDAGLDRVGIGAVPYAHTLYVDGTGGFTDTVSGVTPTQDYHLTTKQYVDDEIATISGGTSDHGALTGLDDDDHAQYHTDARGDARYYTQSQVDTISGALSEEIDSDIVTFSGTIDHDTINNTHNLTTDIDHDQLTNYDAAEHFYWATVSATIDHDTINNTHNLTTDIDHDQLTNFESNEHFTWDSVSGTIDHDTINNTHNLTTDIDHDQLTNYDVNEHFTWESVSGTIDHDTLVNFDQDEHFTWESVSGTIDHDTIQNTHNLTTDIDHGSIAGLPDDDHTQYVPTDASRGFTASVSGIDPTEDYHLSTKQYIDDTIATVSGLTEEVVHGTNHSIARYHGHDQVQDSTASIDDDGNIDGQADITVSGTFIAGYPALTDARIAIQEAPNMGAGNYQGIYSELAPYGTLTSTRHLRGIYVDIDATHESTVGSDYTYGTEVYITNVDNTKDYIYGTYTFVLQQATTSGSSVSNVYGQWTKIDQQSTVGGSCPINNAYGIYSSIERGSGKDPIDNAYLIYGAYAGASPTNKYGIWIQNASTNYIAGNTAVGEVAPTAQAVVAKLNVRDSTSQASDMVFQNSTTGYLSTNGFKIGINSSENVILWNYHQSLMYFATNNLTRMVIDDNAYCVAIGGLAPTGSYTLEVRNTGSPSLFIEDTSTNGANLLLQADNNQTYIYTVSDDAIFIGINNTHAFTFEVDTERYLNFGTNVGSTGYGIRDNAGEMEAKDSGGDWYHIETAGDTSHLHDGDTLQHDGVDSDGGAFAFTTSGTVTFNQIVAGIDPTAATHLTTKNYVDTVSGTLQGNLNTHTGDSTIHFVESSIDHTNIQNIGTNTHADLDTFKAATLERLADKFEPTGFIDRAESAISFDDGTQTLTISGTVGGSNFSYYIDGIKYTISGSKTATISGGGLHFFYMDENEDLLSTTTFTVDTLLKSNAYTAAIYWDDTDNKHVYFGEERHSVMWDWNIHAYTHLTEGTKYETGLGLSDVTAFGSVEHVYDADTALWTLTIVVGNPDEFIVSSDQNHTIGGTNSLDFSNATDGSIAQFAKGTDIDLSDQEHFEGWIYITGWGAGDNVQFYGWDTVSDSIVGNSVNLDGYINTGTTGSWQEFAIPISALGLVSGTINAMRMEIVGSGPPPTGYIDDLEFHYTPSVDDSDLMFGVGSGRVWDEDLDHNIPETVSGTNSLVVLYREGPTGVWTHDGATNVCFKNYSGGDGRVAWNEYNTASGIWQQTEVVEETYTLAHVFATNDFDYPIVGVQSQTIAGTLLLAREAIINDIANIASGNLPFQEFVPIASLIIYTSSGIANSYKANFAYLDLDMTDTWQDFRTIQASSTAGVSISDHGNLSGLNDDDHLQYHTNARGDARYYTQTELNIGQLDDRYYTETEIDDKLTTLSGLTEEVLPGTDNRIARYKNTDKVESSLAEMTDQGNLNLTVTSGGYQIDGDNALSFPIDNTNVAIGYQAMVDVITGATENVGVGYDAIAENQTGDYNTAVGYQALQGTDGNSFSQNTGVGRQVGLALTTGSENDFFGVAAGFRLTTGDNNSFIGRLAGYNITTANGLTAVGNEAFVGGTNPSNPTTGVAVGYQAGYNVETGANGLTLVGYQAGTGNSTGANNTGVGYQALYRNSTGARNTAVGYESLEGIVASNFDDNVAAGYQAGFALSSGINNVIVGSQAGRALNDADSSVLIGYRAGYTITDATGTIAIGYQAGQDITSDYSIAIGYEAAPSTTSVNVLAIGYQAGYSLTSNGTWNTFIGYQSGYLNNAGDNNIGIGYQTLYQNRSGSSNTAIGHSALEGGAASIDFYGNVAVGTNANANVRNGGSYNVTIGTSAAQLMRAGTYNVAVGNATALNCVNGDFNVCLGADAGRGVAYNAYNNDVFIGYKAGYAVTTASDNIAIGYQAGDSITTGVGNIIIGYDADAPATSSYNMFMGYQSGYQAAATASTGSIGIGYQTLTVISGGANNIAIGSLAGTNLLNGSTNVLICSEAGEDLTSGSLNIAIGFQALHTATTGQANVILGYQAQTSINSSNSIVLGYRAKAGSSGVTIGYQGNLNLEDTGDSVIIGANACIGGSATQSSRRNVVIGSATMQNCAAGESSVIIGYQANNQGDAHHDQIIGYQAAWNLENGGSHNTIIGTQAAYDLTTGDYNIAIGYQTLYENVTGSNNIALGLYSMQGVAANSPSNNIAIGYQTLIGVTTATDNVVLGYNAGASITSGGNNVLIGYQAGNTLTSGTDNIIIGYDADSPAGNTSNYLNIGDAITGDLSAGDITIANDLYVSNDVWVTAGGGFGSTVSGVTPTEDYHLVTKEYVDDQITFTISGTVITAHGKQTLVSGTDQTTVTFPSALADATYTTNCTLENTTDNPPSIYPFIVTGTTISGFTVLFAGSMDSANYKLNWTVVQD